MHNHLGRWTRHGMVDDVDRYLRIMDAAGVDKACVNCIFHSDARRGNDIVARVVAGNPERFIPVAFVTPHYPEEAILELERCFDVLGTKYLKIYPSYYQRPIDDPGYFPIFEWCDDRGVAVMGHPSYPGDSDVPKAILKRYAELNRRFPNVKWVLAHGGGGPQPRLDGCAVAAQNTPNIYLETGWDSWTHNAFEGLVERAGAEHVVYGSDMSLFDARNQVGKIATAEIPNEDKRKILGLNAIKLLGLDL